MKPDRQTPYLAPGAPASPRRQALVGLIVSLLSLVGLWAGVDIDVSPEAVGALLGAVATLAGLVMDARARSEQARGVEALEAQRAADLATLPPGAIAGETTAAQT